MPTPDTIPWSDLSVGQWIRWVLPNKILVGEIIAKKNRALRVKFNGESRPRNIPDARMYWANGKAPHPPDEYMELAPAGPRTKASRIVKPTADDFVSVQEAEELYGVAQKDIRRWLRASKVLGQRTKTGTWEVSTQSLGRHLAERR